MFSYVILNSYHQYMQYLRHQSILKGCNAGAIERIAIGSYSVSYNTIFKGNCDFYAMICL